MNMVTVIMALFISLSFNVCAEDAVQNNIAWRSTKDIREHIFFTLEPQRGEVTHGPNFALSDEVSSDDFSEIYLIRSMKIDDEELFTLHITGFYRDNDWRNYSKARTAGGDQLPIVVLPKTKLSCDKSDLCQYEEKLAIRLDFIDVVDAMTSHLAILHFRQQTGSYKNPRKLFTGHDAIYISRISKTVNTT